MTDNIRIMFDWKMFRPDRREYQQNSTEFIPQNVTVALYLDQKYLDSYREDGTPIITIDGMVDAMLQIENAILPKLPFSANDEDNGVIVKGDGEEKTEWEDDNTDDDDGWDKVVEAKNKTKSKTKVEETDWEETWDSNEE